MWRCHNDWRRLLFPTPAIGSPDAHNGIAKIVTELLAAKRVETNELCIDDVCVTHEEFLRMKASAAAGATATDGQQPPTPAAMPASAEADDIGESSCSTPSEIAPRVCLLIECR